MRLHVRGAVRGHRQVPVGVAAGPTKSTGPEVAVKQLDHNGMQGTRDFLVEALMLSLLKQPHLVMLLGFCTDADHLGGPLAGPTSGACAARDLLQL